MYLDIPSVKTVPKCAALMSSGQLGAQLSPVSCPRTAQRRLDTSTQVFSRGFDRAWEIWPLHFPSQMDKFWQKWIWHLLSDFFGENRESLMLSMFIVPIFASSDDTDIVSIQMCPKCKQLTEGFKRFSQSPRWRKLKHYREINVLSTTTTVTLQWRFEQILYASNSYG